MFSYIFSLFIRFWLYLFDRLVLYPMLSWLSGKVGTHFLNLGYQPIDEQKDDLIIKLVRRKSKVTGNNSFQLN